MLIKKISLLIAGMTACILAASTTPQTVQDSMDGNWAVVNGKKIFISGMNIAWLTANTFGNDVGDTKVDINAFTDKVKKIRKAGGNALRWWLHTDASHCPKIDETGAVTGLGSKTISNMSQALDTAYAYGVVVSMCLFSFDMLVPGSGDGKASYSDFNLDNNHKFFTDTSKIASYLENGLKPILDAVGNHPAVLCWEVFNEPEGMLQSANWSRVTKKITQNDILRITNRIAGFVHRNSKKMASTGIAGAQYVSEYSDAKLKAAGKDEDGYLDFYMVHYYPEWAGSELSPFHNPASFWNMDRPVLIGEFPAKSWSSSTTGPSSGQPLKTTKTIEDAFKYAFENGYAGAMSWAMTENASSFFGDYSTTAPALEALFSSHKDDIMIKDVVIEDMKGNYVMKVAFHDIPAPSGDKNYFELGTTFSGGLTGKDSILFDMLVESGSDENLQMQVVIKVGSEYKWSPATDNPVLLKNLDQGQWNTVSVPVSAFGASSVEDVREILIQWWASGSDYQDGAIYIDNVRADKDTLYNFNKEGSSWSVNADGASTSLVKYSNVTSCKPEMRSNSFSKGLDGFSMVVQNKVLNLHLNQKTAAQIRIVNLKGQVIAEFDCNDQAENHSFSLQGISCGHYIAEVRQGMSRLVSNMVIQ